MKTSRILISLCLIAALLLGTFCIRAGANDSTDDPLAEGYTVTRISNPDRGEREVDGLIAGGDRENSYTWRLAQRGDEIYIATTRNIASALVNMYAPAFSASGISVDTFWALIDAVTNGDIPRNDANEGANIISYNRTTGEFKVIYTAGTGDYFRMAVTFGDDVYFGSYSAVPTNPQYILKLDPEGNFTKVFQTMGSVSLRANCVYDDHLFFAGADDRTPLAEGEAAPVAKMAVLMKSSEDDTVWDRVADFRDFGDTAYDPIHESWAGAPIWELASHDGYIYATAPTHAGFVIYKGHPAADGEEPNAYGWYWEEVAGKTNGVNNPGLSDVEGGEPGTMRSLIGSVYEFNGELYAYNFDHSFGGEASAFAGMMQQLAGKDVKASEYLFYLYDSLQNPQKVWKLNDETGRFEELTAFTKLMDGTTNEYVWRLGEYDGDLYVATMDAGIFYNYLTQLTNGSFFDMTAEEKLQKLGYIGKIIEGLAQVKGSEAAAKLKESLEQIKEMLSSIDFDDTVDEETAQTMQEYAVMLDEVKAFADQFVEDIRNMDFDYVASLLFGGDSGDDELAPTGAVVSLLDLISGEELNALIEEAKQKLAGFDIQGAISGLIDEVKAALTGVFEQFKTAVSDLWQKIDGEGIRMYLEINAAVMNDEWGFDLLRTRDGGESFEVITRNGFNDKYNYGCPCFLETEEGLYLGTCNPFYGGQLYLLTNGEPAEPTEPAEPSGPVIRGDADRDGKVTVLDATCIQRHIAGIMGGSPCDLTAADADGDGQVTILDATEIQRWLAELPCADGIGEPIGGGEPAADVPGMKTMGEFFTAYPDAPYSLNEGRLTAAVDQGEHIYVVSSALSVSLYDELIALDIMDPNYGQRFREIVKDVPIESCEDVVTQIIPQNELDALVGKKGQELLDMGFAVSGYSTGEDGTLTLDLSKGCFEYEFTFDGKVDTDAEDFDATEACKTLTVTSAAYLGFYPAAL